MTTEAGERLLAWAKEYHHPGVAKAAGAIEAEAVAAEKAWIRAAVEGLPVGMVRGEHIYGAMFVDFDETEEVIERAAVLAIIDREDTDA